MRGIISCILLSMFSIGESTRCFECQNVQYPRDCKKLTYCNTDEICYVQQVLSADWITRFNLGCKLKSSCSAAMMPLVGRSADFVENRPQNTSTCEECCTGDFCNRNGCGINEASHSQRGPYCFTCDVLNPKTDCNDVNICAIDEVCMLYAPPEFSGLPETIYRGRCETKVYHVIGQNDIGTCAPESTESGILLNKLACFSLNQTLSNDKCLTRCCNTDFCNDKCETPTNTTIAPTPVTTSQTTAPFSHPATTSPTFKPSTKESITFKTTLATSNQGHCNTSGGFVYVHHDNVHMCVHFLHHHRTWDEARHACSNHHADLVVLDTHAKSTAIRKYIVNHNNLHMDFFWIGARDFHKHDHFSWVNGGSVNNGDWGSHQPDSSTHGHGKDCVCMLRSDNHSYTWHNRNCDDKGYFICERK